jgi:hypothetical protein
MKKQQKADGEFAASPKNSIASVRDRHHGRQRSRGFADISLLVSSLCLCIFENFPNWLSALYCGVRIPSSSIP